MRFDPPEADPTTVALVGHTIRAQRDPELVQPRLLGGPRLDGQWTRGDRDPGAPARARRPLPDRAMDGVAAPIADLHLEGPGSRRRVNVDHVRPERQRAGTSLGVPVDSEIE